MMNTGMRDGSTGLQGLVRYGALAVCCLCLLLPVQARAESFVITHAETSPEQKVVILNAGMQLALAEPVLEALKNGVPITVLLTLKVERIRNYLWNKRIATLEQRYVLQYHALSGQYIVRNTSSEQQTHYRSLSLALNALGEIKNLPVIDRHLLEADEKYQLRLHAEIDIDALPSPLRPVAWLSRDWRHGSEWFTCELNF
jgi:hypothetical protein